MASDPLPKAAEAAYLTEALRRCGVLGDASVRSVVMDDPRPMLLSRIIRLRLEYDGAAQDAPRTFILKTGLPGRDSTVLIGQREVAFYTTVAPSMPARVVPGCFEAVWDTDSKQWHILLEDLTDTHVLPTKWPLPPSETQCTDILTARARVHAAWWDDPRLGHSIGTRVDDATTAKYTRDVTGHFGRFADFLGDLLTAERRTIYERVLDAAPRLLGRYRSHRNVTVVHGDAHVWNVFLPLDPADGVRLFDWDSWRVGIPSGDLAYMMATHWYPDRRRRLERPLLDHYHEVLLANGVNGYSRADLDDDYRLSALLQIMTPVWQMAFDLPAWIWWSHFERIMMAIDDLGCRDLL